MIAEGLAFFHIPYDEKAVGDITFYVTELSKWNDRVNLVGYKDIRNVVRDLLYDAFFLWGHTCDSLRTLDLGSGSGIIAIPLKILSPGMEVYPVDRSLRKIQFQRHIKRSLQLEGFFPIHGRIEEVEPLMVDSVVVKAFGAIPAILEMSERHLNEAGRVFIVKGMAEEAVRAGGFALESVVPYTLPGSGRRYRMFVYRKDGC
ncbi:MAG: class I SAM-dependent methyltransferase [Syntrophobacterales bacterium]|jgi:16S rRNA (guanine527-N7)-methyltransferase|nr:class I SAM-dependent methyltransferase [Syntrophobacterales bacterium]